MNNYYYNESLKDIRHNVECLLFFRKWKMRYKHTQLEKFWDSAVDLLKKEQKELIEKHKNDWDDDVDVKTIEDSINNIAMRKNKAVVMIKQILDSGILLTESEQKFLESVYDSLYDVLTEKQAKWLKTIYERIF